MCAWSLENNAPNKGEVAAAAAAFSSGVRPLKAAGVTKKVSRAVVARGLTSDCLFPRPLPIPLHSRFVLFRGPPRSPPLPSGSPLCPVFHSPPLPSFPEYRTRTLAWTETVKTS